MHREPADQGLLAAASPIDKIAAAPSGLVPRQGLFTLAHVIYALHAFSALTGLDSHFSWQIRTFWYALLWLALGGILFVTLVGIPAAIVLWLGTGIWVLYRIIRGWMALTSEKELPR